MTERASGDAIAHLLALVVHDLRNPVATIGANLSFVREVAPAESDDTREALDDVETALGELARGLEQLSWIGRWIGGEPALDAGPGDVRTAVRAAVHRMGATTAMSLPDEPIEVASGGSALSKLVELLVQNARAFADPSSIEIVARAEEGHAVVEVRDAGRAIADELQAQAFTLGGQNTIKGRADGRYSRVAGLFAARTLADAMGAELSAGGSDGAAFFRVRLPRA